MGSRRPSLCAACKETTKRVCERCKNARYCSKACQEIDWPTHKLLCGAFAEMNNSTRPTDNHVKAIFFPVDEAKPKLIWLPWEDDGFCQIPQFTTVLGTDSHGSANSIAHSPFLHRDLPNTIFLGHRGLFTSDGSKTNKSISRIEDRNPRSHYNVWKGPVVAYVMDGEDGLICKDIDMNDFCHICDWLVWFNMTQHPVGDHLVIEKIRGIRINCHGDQKMLKRTCFERIEVFTTDPIFCDKENLQRGTSDVADRIGIPVFTRKCPPNQQWVNDQNNAVFGKQDPFTNLPASYLHICCDPKTNVQGVAGLDHDAGEPGWGRTHLKWQKCVGNVLIVRQDMKPLSPLTMEALYNYCRYMVHPLLKRAEIDGQYNGEDTLSTEAALAMICRPTFSAAFENLVDKKNAKKEKVDDTNPYYV